MLRDRQNRDLTPLFDEIVIMKLDAHLGTKSPFLLSFLKKTVKSETMNKIEN